MTKEEAVTKASADLAARLGVPPGDVAEESVESVDFPDMSLGAPVDDEMSGQMISPGWRITLKAQNESYEYRADRRQLRLYDFEGANYLV